MLVKIEKFISRAFILIALLLLFSIGGVYFWAVTGPRDLAGYIPEIENSINDVLGDGRVKISKAELSWGGIDELLKVEVFDTKLEKDDEVYAQIKKMDLDFDLLAIISGRLIPREIVIYDSQIIVPEFEQESSSQTTKFDLSSISQIGIKNTNVTIPQLDKDFLITKAGLLVTNNVGEYFIDISSEEYDDVTITGKLEQDKRNNTNITAKTSRISLRDFVSLEGVDLSAELEASLNREYGDIKGVDIELTSIEGRIDREELRSDLEVVNGKASLLYDISSSEMDIKQADLEFDDGTQLAALGKVLNFEELNIDVTAGIKTLEVTNLYKYWPANLGDNAIKWVNDHMPAGEITSGKAVIKISPEMFTEGRLNEEAIDLNFDFSNMEIDYKPGLLPVTNAYGRASMDADSIEFNIEGAKLNSSHLSETTVLISDIGTEEGYEKISISGKVKGGAKELADFYEKLGKGEKYFKKDKILKGNAESDVKLRFPLRGDLKMQQVSIDLDSKITDAEINDFMGDLTTKKFGMDIKIDDTATTVKGNFIAYPDSDGETVVITEMPVAFDLSLQNGNEVLDMIADLESAKIYVPALGINKAAGQAAKLKAKKTLRGQVSKFESLKFESPVLNFTASGFGSFDNINSLQFSNLSFSGSSVAGSLKNIGSSYVANLVASRFNLVPVLDYIKADDEDDDSDGNYNISLSSDNVLLKNDQILNGARINLICEDGDCEDLSLAYDEGSIETSSSSIKITSSNVEKLLKGFDVYEHLVGGKIILDAKILEDDLYSGNVIIRDFDIVKGKFLPQILTIGSLTGIANTLQGKGISFKKLSADFTKKDGRIDIKNFKMYGSAIGVTAEGWLNTDTDQIEISGNVIPAYTANTLLGKIPLLGDLIIGDEGIFAISYKISGNLEKPETVVNPLSVLAPGVIKNVFK